MICDWCQKRVEYPGCETNREIEDIENANKNKLKLILKYCWYYERIHETVDLTWTEYWPQKKERLEKIRDATALERKT